MKKLFVHLSILCLLAILLVPMVGCKGDDTAGEETPMTDTTTTDTTEPMDTGMTDPMDTGMTTDMTMEPMGTDMSTPPAQ
ncbi:MAG TPA: hypothetical protein VN493_09800 [Thermoanaerobaculia bacterium]|nr:hypothetical protein [Thermoanaerobaculia bacterium]